MEILSLRQRLDRIDWSGDWEKADQENVQILEELCRMIESELNKAPKSEAVNAALILLAENTGCAEDFERYEQNFVDRLAENGLLSKEQAELFYHYTNRRQG